MIFRILLLPTFVFLFCSIVTAQTGSVKIKVNGLKNSKGILQIGLYNSEEDFPQADKIFKGFYVEAEKDSVSYFIANIITGKYAIAVFYDENENDKLDKKIFGIPKERYGFSNNKFGTFGPPDYNDISFTLVDNEIKKLIINLK